MHARAKHHGAGGFNGVFSETGELLGLCGRSGRWYVGSSIGCLNPWSPLRLLAIKIVDSKWFDRVMLVGVAANALSLAVEGRPEDSLVFVPAPTSARITLGFICFFAAEVALKGVAFGFLHAFSGDERVRGHSYFADRWNAFDFAVVSISLAWYLLPNSASDSQSMRLVRALRPLRSINMLPALKRQVATIFHALPRLRDVYLLIASMMLVYGVLGIQLFREALHYRCFPHGAEAPSDPEFGVCNHHLSAEVSDSVSPTHLPLGVCPHGEACLFYPDTPAFGALNFDHLLGAWLTLFQCMSGEGWSSLMYLSARASGLLAYVYFISIVILGTFLLMNLFIAVLWQT